MTFVFSFPSEFLHRAADLTLVPSAAIGRDLEAARVTAGEHKHLIPDHIAFNISLCQF
jgi:hypothetical protein